MSNRWNHAICERDFAARHPGRTPHRLVGDYRETTPCCYCGQFTFSGIYVRDDPKTPGLLCHQGDDHEED